MEDYMIQAQKECDEFIKACIENDVPRLAKETYPDDVGALYDIPYGDGKYKYDVYLPSKEDENQEDIILPEAFFIIHGGAFVYGVKENNKLFGMHLTKRSGIPSVNIDYPLMPGVSLKEVYASILQAAAEASVRYGIKKFHVTGDSAGGLLSFTISEIIYSEKLREDLGLKLGADYCLGAALPICGCYRNARKGFPGCYFENGSKLPDYVFDIGEMVKIYGAPKTLFVTGEDDFLREDNEYIRDVFNELGLECEYYIGMNKDDRIMSHIFPVPHPEWPESIEVLDLMINHAKA